MMYEKILEVAASTKAINTHCHHLKDDFFIDLNFNKLLLNTYVNWSGVSFDSSKESMQNYIDKVRFKSYYKWLQKALKEIYKISEDLSLKNWDYYSEVISSYYIDDRWHKKILKDYCKYEKIILDTRWDPGSNNKDPEIFTSTFRIDPLFFGYSKDTLDHDGNNLFGFYHREFTDIDSFIFFIRELITEKIKNGCVSIKSAIAYDRALDYESCTKDEAQRVFRDKEHITRADIKLFQDYFFFEVCKLAMELDVPIQCHTGLGCLDNTNAINMLKIIKANPDTKFVLFHGSFPWSDDIIGLLHSCQNVYPDICWLPLLSPTAAEHTLHQLIEVGTSDKICWGCDTWTSEESYGARLAINDVLASVLSTKIEKGYLNMNDAECIVENILYNNPKSLYKIKIQ